MKKILFLIILLAFQFSFSQSDCISAIPVCGNSGLAYTPSGPGLIDEELGGCMSTDERFTVWYSFTVGTAGTLAFTINPNVFADDYDFAVYGPDIPCSQIGTPTGQPIRCNYSGADGPTGLSLTVVHPTVSGQWSGFMNVLPGETYYLVVDNYSMSPNGFTLTWEGTASLLSPFNDPAIQPNPFLEPGPNQDGEVIICENPQMFDFSTLSSEILNGNPNFTVDYYATPNDALTGTNPITTPISVSDGSLYHYTISYLDPNNPNNPANDCKNFGEITFTEGVITADDATLIECSNNNSGVAEFDLTSAPVFNDPTATIAYYPSMADLNAGTNEITNPASYFSAQGDVFALVTTQFGCTATATITLQHYALINEMDDALVACYIIDNPTNGLFDLTEADVTTTGGVTLEYYASQTDAETQNNPIADPTAYTSPDAEVYVRIIDANGCWKVAKITLTVTPPHYSPVLKDVVICIEDVATLDAGSGYDDYQWSNGETTQTASNLPIGEYWVDLTYDNCVTRQYVKVIPAPNPVIKFIDITNNTLTVTVEGGEPPYQYSLDNITWQDSNIFTNVPRGAGFVYVKDSFDCEPVLAPFLLPNLINAITPNGDNINDFIDYSELAITQDFKVSIYDRYGTQVAEANKNNGYKWDGTIGDRKEKVPSGTYWYSITWTKDGTGLKFSNWILVKNRE